MIGFSYVQQYRDNRGKMRRYFRRKGVRVALPGEPGSPQFQTAYATALAGVTLPKGAGPAPAKGTIAGLVAAYYGSTEYLILKPITKQSYRQVLEHVRKAHGDKRVAKLERRHIKAEIAKLADRPGAANKFLKHIKILLEHAIELEWIASNPARGIKKLKTPGDGFKKWPEALIEKYEAHWPLGTKQRLAFDLLLYTGQRRQAIPAMSRAHVRNGELRVFVQKTEVVLWIPVHPALQASIDATPRTGLNFLETSYGRPFSVAGFGNWFREQCEKAGIPAGYAAHGLRKTACTRLADAGCTPHQIMAITGHKTLSEVERYTRGADQRRNAREAIEKVTRGTEQKRKMSSTVPHVSSRGPK
jgi:integrase